MRVLPLLAEDIPRLYQIRDAALTPTQAPVTRLIFLPPLTPQAEQRDVALLQDDNSFFFKAVHDADPALAISVARFRRVKKSPDCIGSTTEIKYPPIDKAYAPVGQTAWDTCWTTVAQVKRQAFPDVEHFCKCRKRPHEALFQSG